MAQHAYIDQMPSNNLLLIALPLPCCTNLSILFYSKINKMAELLYNSSEQYSIIMDKKKSLLALTGVAAGTVIYNLWIPVISDLPVIQDVDVNMYLGKLYEIGRIHFFWEKVLINVTAEYSVNDDCTIQVSNSGQRIKD